MKKFKLLSLLLIISMFLCLFPAQALALDAPVITAPYAIVMNTDTGEILYEQNSGQVVPTALLSTLMSAVLVGEALDSQSIGVNDAVTASENVSYNLTENSYSVGIVPGEVMTVNDLLYCGVLGAAEDAWNVLAEYSYGSIDAFVAAMNAKAAELGCTSSYFVNANGSDAEGQVTSARDLAVIARALAAIPSVQTAYSTSAYTVPATNMSGIRNVTSSNALLNPSSEYYYGGAYGFRNDRIDGVGSAVVAAATYNELDVIVVVLGSPDSASRFTDAKTLFDWAFANYGYRTLLSTTDILGTLPVAMGSPDSVSVRASDSIQVIMPADRDLSNLELKIEYEHEKQGTELQAPLAVGDYLGEVTVLLDGEVQGSSRLVAATAVDISRVEYLRAQLQVLMQNSSVRQIVTILLVCLGVYLLLVVVYTIQRFLHLRSLRKARKERAAARAQQEIGWLDIPSGEETYAPQEPEEAYYEEPSEEPAEDDGQYDEDQSAEDGEDGEYYEEEPAPEEDGEFHEEEPAPEEDGEFYEEEPAPEEDGEFYEDEDQYAEDGYAEDGEYYEDEGEYAEDEPYDEGEGPDEPPAPPKRRWWKR